MTGELEHALAELAGELGTTTGELWGYLTDGGIQAYARATVAVSATYCIFSAVFIFAFSLIVVRTYKRAHDDGVVVFDLGIDEVLWFCIALGGDVAAFVALCENLSQVVGWLASPEGMAMRTLVEKLG